jgi:hypothetical protein
MGDRRAAPAASGRRTLSALAGAALLAAAAVGCHYYLSERGAAAPPPAGWCGPSSADRADPARSPPGAGATAASAVVPSRLAFEPRRAIYPGERHLRAVSAGALTVLARDVLRAGGYEILRVARDDGSGEVDARRRESVARAPASGAAAYVTAVRLHIVGGEAEDCCYVRATVTVTELDRTGYVLAVRHGGDSAVEETRGALLDEVARRLADLSAR